VLVHGFTGARIDWTDVIDDLARDRRVVAWTHRGHGDSTNTADPHPSPVFPSRPTDGTTKPANARGASLASSMEGEV